MRKGFTLIELLAVIVILAIIALIAIPIVLNIINEVNQSSNIESMKNLERAVELYYANNQIKEDIVFECSDGVCKNGEKILQMKGKAPSQGKILVDKKGNITYEDLVLNGYNCYKEHDKHICSKDKIRKIFTENSIVINTEKESNVLDYKIYGNSVQGKLPSEYQQVEYIESTGTQFLEIDYIASGITSSKGKFQITDTTKIGFLFASRGSGGTVFYGLNWGGGSPYKYYNSYDRGYITSKTIDDQVHVFWKDKGNLYIDNILLHESNYMNFTTPGKMVVFGSNENGFSGYLIPSAKIYYLQFYDEDVLKIDLIPCYRKSDNVIGMYDLVTKTFYTNKGIGTFLKGNNTPTPDIPIEIESVGDMSTNLFDISTITPTSTIIVNDDKSLTVSGYPSNSSVLFKECCPNVKVGDTVCFDMETDGYYGFYLLQSKTTWNKNANTYVITEEMLNSRISFYRKTSAQGSGDATIRNFQINLGTTPLEYEPYGYRIPVKASGSNLIDYRKVGDDTVYGIKYTNNNDGTYTANGTLTGTLSSHVLTKAVDLTSFKVGETYVGTCGQDYKGETKRYYMFVIIKNNETGVNRYFSSASASSFTLAENENVTAIEIRINAPTGELFEVKDVVFTPYIAKSNELPEKLEAFVEPVTTNIYLKEPLRKIGDYADYVDYKNQKVVRYIEKLEDGTLKILKTPKEENVELPRILLNKGINNISIETEVSPSKIELEYYK